LLKNYKVSYILGWIVVILGVIELIYIATQNRMSSSLDLLNPIGLILIGLANFVAGNSLKWIAN